MLCFETSVFILKENRCSGGEEWGGLKAGRGLGSSSKTFILRKIDKQTTLGLFIEDYLPGYNNEHIPFTGECVLRSFDLLFIVYYQNEYTTLFVLKLIKKNILSKTFLPPWTKTWAF